jgi:hypothetical protein
VSNGEAPERCAKWPAKTLASRTAKFQDNLHPLHAFFDLGIPFVPRLGRRQLHEVNTGWSPFW